MLLLAKTLLMVTSMLLPCDDPEAEQPEMQTATTADTIAREWRSMMDEHPSGAGSKPLKVNAGD